MTSVMAWDCTVQPAPKVASTAKTAKRTASHLMPRPRSIVYMGPPAIEPSLSRTRYLTDSSDSAYLVEMPNTPVIQHQNTAPGPPRATAVETPTILPVPMVAASAVASAPNCEMSPLAPSSALADIRMARNVCRWMNRRRNVRNKCVPNSSTIMGAPQMRSRSQEIALAKNMIDLPFLFQNVPRSFFGCVIAVFIIP